MLKTVRGNFESAELMYLGDNKTYLSPYDYQFKHRTNFSN
ncbi:hypothetical protein AM1_C0361 (plasmid) [Acaryochloris marina MBIC11017]|uniref:Uncharacterized protein n=1 Tax=Acaryochloris marina (strain MBIC 11017) TaxID=329726 RepID=A8ZN89_ACAM1|nr:hypothetical protein AM1_C0361 [Acaryochloris marina MBIC11017]